MPLALADPYTRQIYQTLCGRENFALCCRHFYQNAEPEETIEALQTYHEEMRKLINQHGADIDLRMGHGVMVLFNDLVPRDDPAGDVVRLAVAMRAQMAKLCTVWKRLGHRLGFGVGVSLGYAMRRMTVKSYRVSGRELRLRMTSRSKRKVNSASRASANP